MLLGRNFDWYEHPALILFTDPPDGYASVSMVDISYLGVKGDIEQLTEACGNFASTGLLASLTQE